MKKKRLDRDLKWGFQHFPYYQMRVDIEAFQGLVCLIQLTDGETLYWNLPKAGKAAVAGQGMTWLQMIPDGQQRLITAKYLPDGKVSVWYVDVIDGVEYAEDGVAVYVDKYLDVYFTPQGDVVVDDREELEEAYQSGELSQEQYEGAIQEGNHILAELCTDVKATEAYCNKVLEHVKRKITEGEKLFKANSMNIELVLYKNETEEACSLIKGFWKAHNGYEQSPEESRVDLKEWTKEGHKFYFIVQEKQFVGFVHLGSRGCQIDWLEDIFVLPELQGRGIASQAIRMVEEIVKEYSESLYIEAAARNEKAIRLYQKLGYNCLNTITIRKDFCPENFDTIRKEQIGGLEFEVKKYRV